MLRDRMRAVRAFMTPSERSRADRRVAQRFLETVLPGAGGIVALYYPIGDELDPRPLVKQVSGEVDGFALPVVDRPGRPLFFRRWASGDPLVEGHYGILVPRADAPVVRPDVIAVPLLGFDEACHRLGYGGGYYDRTLESMRRGNRDVIAVGVAYERQRMAWLPRHEGDQPLDMVITEHAVHLPQANTELE